MTYDIVLVFSVVLLVLNEGAHLWMRSFAYQKYGFLKKYDTRHIFWLNIIIIFFLLLSLTGVQYYSWEASAVTSYLLPPTTPITYFIQYVFFRIWASHVVSCIIAVLFIFIARIINKKKEQMLLHDGEEWLLGSALFLSGFPGVVIFLPVFLLLFLFSSIFKTIQKGVGYRVSPYFLWLPTALCVILIIYLFFTDASWWTTLRL